MAIETMIYDEAFVRYVVLQCFYRQLYYCQKALCEQLERTAFCSTHLAYRGWAVNHTVAAELQMKRVR